MGDEGFHILFTHEQRKRSAEGSDEEKETPDKQEKKKSKKDKKKSKEKEKVKEKDSSDEVSKNYVWHFILQDFFYPHLAWNIMSYGYLQGNLGPFENSK